MSSYDKKLKNFVIELFKIDAIKFGDFITKGGIPTPVYCDLRVIVSFPKLLNHLADLLIERTKEAKSFDIICGVPYTALPIAAIISTKTGIPMVMRRKEAKDYGTKRMIEGTFKQQDRCLIIEDVITSGSSILETVKDLTDVGIKCTDAILLLNREQGGERILREHGITAHALLTLTEVMQYLKEANYVDDQAVEKVARYLATTQVNSTDLVRDFSKDRLKLPYDARIQFSKNAVASQLFKIMSEKQTNLCIAADVTNATKLLNLAEQVGPHICLFKTHIDIVDDFNSNLLKSLKTIAKTHNFVLFEDRKFADIGKTVELQYSTGIFKISSWANVVTAHSLTGNGVLDAIKQSPGLEERGVFLLAEASSTGSLINDSYTKSTVKLATDYKNLITGVVCQSPLFLNNPGFIQLTPGVQLEASGDSLGQQYNSPENVVLERGADIAVVGRGITEAPEPAVAAKKYQKLLWDAYLKRIEST